MSLLYKEQEDMITSVEIKQGNEIIKFKFDAKKEAESLYENWGKYLQVTFGVVKKIQLKAILIKHLYNNTTYTQIQRQQILTELEHL